MKKGDAAIQKKAQRLEILKVESVEIGLLSPNSYNPNRQSDYDFELLCRSVIEDGYTQPIVAQKSSRIIVDGEHRWTALIVVLSLALEYDLAAVARGDQKIDPAEFRERRAKRLEWLEKVKDEQVQVVFVDMSLEQAKIATLRHNRARGEEDIELTAMVLRDLQELGALDWAQDSLQMTDDEIARMIDDIDVPEALAGDDFTEAWEPSASSTVETNASTEAKTDKAVEGTITSAMTTAAIETQRQRERQLEQAKTEEEREKAREENRMHRVNLVFSGDDGQLVQEVLGNYPAEKLAKMCAYWKENNLDEKLEG